MKGMAPDDYFQFHEQLCDEARALSQRKNNDYADPDAHSDDPFCVFRNFMMCEHASICSVEQGFLVRLSDKFMRLCNLLRPGHEQAVEDESVDDTIKDIINYSVLLAALRKLKKEIKDGQVS